MPVRTKAATLTTTEVAVLGLLMRMAMSGYDLKKAIDSSVAYFWGPAKSQIYAVLPRLVEAGLVTAKKVAQSQRPDKKVYRITAAGRAALRAWIEGTPPPPDPDRNPLLLKLFFGEASSPEVLAEQVRARRLEAERLRETLEDTDSQADPTDLYPALTRRWGLEYADAVIRWAHETEDLLARAGEA